MNDCKRGITKDMFAQMSVHEVGYLIHEFREYHKHLSVPIVETFDDEGTMWWDITDKRTDGFLMGYLICMGFDENGERHSK